MPLPDGPFTVVYADPPWRFKTWTGAQRAKRTAESYYPTMTLADLADLGYEVKRVAAPDGALFLWTPCCMLREAIYVMTSWGYRFKTVAFTWVKTNRRSGSLFWGMGHWTRNGTELCLVGTRGKVRRVARNVHSVVMAPPTLHSAKPVEVRDRIVALMGDVPRLEMFARERADGWEAWGDEVPAP